MNKYLVTLSILIVVVILVGISVIFLYEKPNQPNQVVVQKAQEQTEVITSEINTSDWELYKSKEFGYSFKLPPEFIISDEYYGEPIAFNPEGKLFDIRVNSSKYNNEDWQYQAQMSISVLLIGSEDGPESIDDYINKYVVESNKKISKLYTTDDGVTFYRRNITQGNYSDIIHHNDVIISLSFSGINEVYIDKIISSIKFIEPTYDKGWQTYRNEELGFEFRYPNTWTMHEYKKGEPKQDPTISTLTLSLYEDEHPKLFVIVDDTVNLDVYQKPNKNVVVNGKKVGLLEKDGRIQVIFSAGERIISFTGVQPIEQDIFYAIILSYKD